MSVVLHLASGTHLAAMAQASGCGLASWAAHDTPEPAKRDRALRIMAGLGIGVALILQIALIGAHATEVLEAPSADVRAWVAVASDTWTGRVLLVQSAGLLAVGIALAAGSSLVLVGLGSALCIAGGALGGHAGAESAWSATVSLVHITLACLWFGSLPCLLVAAASRGRCNADPLIDMLRRFSPLALPGMALILLSGVALSVPLVGGQAGLFGTAYGATLLAKLALVAAALICAARLRTRVTSSSLPHTPERTRRLLGLEAAFALAAVLLAGILANLPPGAHVQIVWPWPIRVAPWSAWQTVQGAVWQMIAAAGLLLGGVALAILARWRRHGTTIAAACAAIAGAAGLGLPAMIIPAYPTTFAHATVPYDATAITTGSRIYQANCTACHGVTGRGDGLAAAGLLPPPADLTAPHLGFHTHGDLYWWISHGLEGTAMPGFAASLDERQRWSALQFLLALSLGHQARPLGPVVVPRDPWLPSIDFALPDGSTLAWLRGKPVVLLFARDAQGFAEAARLVDGGVDTPVLVIAAPELAGSAPPSIRVVPDRDGEIWRAWSLYRRTLAHPDFEDREKPPAVLGVLIDRFGFVRARWRSDDGNAPSAQTLANSVRALAQEPEIASADDHAH